MKPNSNEKSTILYSLMGFVAGLGFMFLLNFAFQGESSFPSFLQFSSPFSQKETKEDFSPFASQYEGLAQNVTQLQEDYQQLQVQAQEVFPVYGENKEMEPVSFLLEEMALLLQSPETWEVSKDSKEIYSRYEAFALYSKQTGDLLLALHTRLSTGEADSDVVVFLQEMETVSQSFTSSALSLQEALNTFP